MSNGAIAVEVEKDKSYYWCSCGKSAKQPFCDGSHKGTEFTPLAYKASETKRMFFCACKKTDNQLIVSFFASTKEHSFCLTCFVCQRCKFCTFV